VGQLTLRLCDLRRQTILFIAQCVAALSFLLFILFRVVIAPIGLFQPRRGAVALSRQRFTLGPFFRISWRWITLRVVESLVVGVLVALCTMEGERRLLEEFSGRVRRCIRLA